MKTWEIPEWPETPGEGEPMRCGACGSDDIYYDTNPHNLPPLMNADGTPYRCLMGVIQTGEPGAERCRACGSLEIEFINTETRSEQ